MMAEQERRLNVRICKATINGAKDTRMFLTELPDWIEPLDDSPNVQCGIFCELADQYLNEAG